MSPRSEPDGERSISEGAAVDGQHADGEDDVIPGTIRKGPLPGTGGPPLLVVPWVLAFVAAGAALLRRS